MIVTKLCGGLGNQMFQYAMARRLALDHEAPLYLDLRDFVSDPLRDYRLAHLRIQAEIATSAILRHFAAGSWRTWRGLRRLAPYIPVRGKVRQERDFAFDPAALECRPPIYLSGFWQSERYFASVADHIRTDFQLNQPMTADREALAARMRATQSVSLHVRRGDYVTNAHTNAYHGVMPIEWYQRAMAMMAEAQEQPTFFVFSDDPAWVRDNMSAPWPMEFVDPDPDGREFEDMHLMACCRNHITANSSFSWWGAWLNPRLDKRVIVPRRWFDQGGQPTTDLIPREWFRL